MTHLQKLEAQSIAIIRECFCQFENTALLFSGGKDSIALFRLAQKAFDSDTLPFPLLHIDTGHNFPEVIEFRDKIVKENKTELIVRSVEDSLRRGRVQDERGLYASRNVLQTTTLLDAITELKLDSLIGGARRDEEKSRAKERIFSHRDSAGRWNPEHQQPELWNLYGARSTAGGHMRIFPLSDWTELDVWTYIRGEKLSVPSIYFSHLRDCRETPGGTIFADSKYLITESDSRVYQANVRCRTVGDMTCTGLIHSDANSLDAVITELMSLKNSERGSRLDDQRSESAMENRKREGYF